MKSLINIVGLTSLVTLNSLLLVGSANAFTVTFNNPGFEDSGDGGFTSWTTTGDASVQPIFQAISPTADTYQALITNACHDCIETNNGNSFRNDDSGTEISTFNYSSANPVDATSDSYSLQNALKLDDNALDIFVEDGATVYSSFTRTPKEGSGILSDTFTVDENFTLSFNWNYLTNDGATSTLGDQDFSFVTIYSVDGGGEPVTYYANNDSYSQIDVLADSTGSIPTVTDDDFNTVGTYNTYTSGILAPGSYRVGYGVVDVDGVDRSSALLVDNITFQQQVPFKFSPTAGIAFMLGLIGCDRLRRRMKMTN